MADNLEEQFHKACDHLPSLINILDSSVLLKFYAFYKQSTVGECNIEKPAWYSMEKKSKFNAWSSLGAMEKSEAMVKYIELLNEVDKGWKDKAEEEIDWDELKDSREQESDRSKGWVNVSSLVKDENELNDDEKNIYEWAKEGNINMLTMQLSNMKDFNINQRDENGLSCLHWACDRGHLDIVKFLIENCAADVNLTDEEGDTGLDYAKSIEHNVLIDYLIKSGAH